MATLGSSELQNNGGENLASESNQPAGRIALLPFSRKCCVDKGLKLSNEKFKEKIYYFF
jgi:hypothetical protein